MRRIDVGLEPIEQGHRLGGAAQQTGVHVAVVQTGEDGVTGGVDHLGVGCERMGVDRLDGVDGDDRVVDEQHRAVGDQPAAKSRIGGER